jgi:hypothetical protein
MAMIATCTLFGELLGDKATGTSPYDHVASISLAVFFSYISVAHTY